MGNLNGVVASRGCAEGRPRVIHSQADLASVQTGDILVAAQTDITYTAALMRAAGIVTEEGGRFCHAAIWAREHRKPALIAVAGARKALAGVETASLDAVAGRISWEER